jgi:RNA polymerase sigma factor (sigma-70 family)
MRCGTDWTGAAAAFRNLLGLMGIGGSDTFRSLSEQLARLTVSLAQDRSDVPTTMPGQQDYSALLERHVPWIDRVAARLARRHGLDGDETDDFAGWAKARLVEDDYAVLRKYRGESAITTYLTVVMNRLYQDYRVSRWGRWRPSAAARRRGPLAVLLETLVHRDRMTLAQAIEVARSRGWPELADREATALLAELPDVRGRPKQTDDASLERAPAEHSADAAVIEAETAERRRTVRGLLGRAMEGLPDEDRRIVEMRFYAGATIAEVARVLRIEQKPLYRRLERILEHLRRKLEAEGISIDRVREIIDDDS